MGSSGERRTPQFRHARLEPPELVGLELALLDLLRQLDSINHDCRVVESFEPSIGRVRCLIRRCPVQ
jgi:hypothetical protein